MTDQPDGPQDLARILKAAGKELQGVADTPDPQTQVEQKTVELEKAQAELLGLKQDIDERKKYAGRIFILVCCWVAAMFALLLCDGFGSWWWLRFALPVSVLLAAIGSTTVNVLGLFYIVAHYLFPDRTTHKINPGPGKD